MARSRITERMVMLDGGRLQVIRGAVRWRQTASRFWGSVLIELGLIGTVVSALYCVPCAAQSIRVGVVGGATAARFSVDDPGLLENPYDWRLGVSAGARVVLALHEAVALEAELLYVTKGAGGPGVFDMHVRYLETSLLLKMATLTRGAVRPVVAIGVAPANELSCGGWTQPYFVQGPAPDPVPLDCDEYRTETDDFGLVFGAGAEFSAGDLIWTAEVRHTRGIRDIASRWEFVVTQNRAYSLLLGLHVRLF